MIVSPHLHIVHAHDVPTVVHVLFEVFVLQDEMWLLDRKWLKLHLKNISHSNAREKNIPVLFLRKTSSLVG